MVILLIILISLGIALSIDKFMEPGRDVYMDGIPSGIGVIGDSSRCK